MDVHFDKDSFDCTPLECSRRPDSILRRREVKTIMGYVSSDESGDDEYDFGYSEPLVLERREPPMPEVTTHAGFDCLDRMKLLKNFFKAAERSDLEALGNYLFQGIDVDCHDEQGWSALMRASGMGNPELVLFLLEKGADPNGARELLTPLMMCCTNTMVDEDSKLSCVRHLLRFGASVNPTDKYRTTALIYACSGNYVRIADALLELEGIDVNVQDSDGWTALFHAVKQNNLELVRKLKQAKTNLKLTDKYGRTAIDLAVDKNFRAVATELGYVEEMAPAPVEQKGPRERFLDELPHENGDGGFWEDAKMILETFKQTDTKKISLPDLLNATDEDLRKIGVKLKPQRDEILNQGIHGYHLQPWTSNSMPKLKRNVPSSMEESLTIMGSVAKHLTIANASIKYVSRKLATRTADEPIEVNVEKEILSTLVELYEAADSTNSVLCKITEEMDKKIKLEIPADYIYPLEKKKNPSMAAKYCCIFATAVVGFLLTSKADYFYKKLFTVFHFFDDTGPLFFINFSRNK